MNAFPDPSHDPRPVFVIGSLVLACCARVPRCPGPGESLRADGFVMEAGGKGFNLALAAHRLGVPVDGLFAVGDDAAGGLMRAAFARAGLPSERILTMAGPTGAGVGLIEADGENRIAVFPGANDELSEADVAAAAGRLRNASLVVGQFEAPDAAIRAAFATARGAGVATLLNPSPYRPIAPALLEMTDIMIVNQGEAQAVAADLGIAATDGGVDRHAALARALHGHGVGMLVVTRGRDGAILWHAGECHVQPAFHVEAVDSIGAGDAFTGGLIAALAGRQGFEKGLRWGCAVAALTVARLGLIDALPGLAELEAFLDTGHQLLRGAAKQEADETTMRRTGFLD